MAGNLPPFDVWLEANGAASKYGVDPALVHRVIAAESGYNPNAVSPKGALGVMQLMPGTAKDLGVTDPHDYKQNIDGGVRYLAQLSKQFNGDQEKVAAAYNFGPRHVAEGAPLPTETQNYVSKVAAGAGPQNSTDPLPDFGAWMKTRQSAPPTQSAPLSPSAEAPEEPSTMGFLNNVLNSGGRAIAGVANTVLHPIDTAKGLANAVTHPGQVVDFYKKRYGGVDEFLHTLYDDPVGAAMDASMILEPAALGAKVAGFADTARVLRAGAEIANPLSVPAKALESASVAKYANVLKPARALVKSAETAGFESPKDFARFGLEHGINITDKGADKAQRIGENAANVVQGNVDRASAAGASVHPREVTSTMPDLIASMQKDLNPEAKVASATDAEQEFYRKFIDPNSAPQGVPTPHRGPILYPNAQHGASQGPLNLRAIPLDELQDIKKTSYQYTPNSAWVSDAVPPALREARQTMTKRAKELIEDRTAGFENGGMSTRDANQQYAQSKKLMEAIDQRSAHPGGLLRHVAEILGGVEGGHPGLGVILSILDNPANWSRLTQVGYRAPGAARVAAPAMAVTRALQD